MTNKNIADWAMLMSENSCLHTEVWGIQSGVPFYNTENVGYSLYSCVKYI